MKTKNSGRAGRLVLGLLIVSSPAAYAAVGRAAVGRDDLAVVRKAVGGGVAQDVAPTTTPAPDPVPAPAHAAPRHRAGYWLKVRVVENGAKRSRVTVSLPLSVVRALGDDCPAVIRDSRLRLCDILRSLEAGEPIVEVKDKDSDVRVWVE